MSETTATPLRELTPTPGVELFPVPIGPIAPSGVDRAARGADAPSSPTSDRAPATEGPASSLSAIAAPPRSMADQLPTSRLPSLPGPLPPAVPPPGPAHVTQPLRALSRGAADARLPERKPGRWSALVARAARTAATVPGRFAIGAPAEPLSRRSVGLACGALGLILIATALCLGWTAVGNVHVERPEQVALGAALVVARAALAVAGMLVGGTLVRVGERLAFALDGEPAKRAPRAQG